MIKAFVAIVTAAMLGVVGSRYLLVGSWLSLVPWAAVGLLLGAWSTRREWAAVGAMYGFVLSFVFMWAGYSGAASVVRRVPFFALLGAFGAVCGVVLGFLGFSALRLLHGSPGR